jgi:hypothetical protein
VDKPTVAKAEMFSKSSFRNGIALSVKESIRVVANKSKTLAITPVYSVTFITGDSS